MKVKLTTIVAVLITIAAAVFFAHTTKIHRIYDSNINNVSYTDMGVPEDGLVYSQKFVCMKDTVDGFTVKTGVAGSYADAVVILEVKDAQTGDVLVNGKWLFEIGGRKKSFSQIKDIPDSYLAVADTEIGRGNRIPIWMFGLLY